MSDLREKIERAGAILDAAIAEHRPVAVFAAFSGGNDSIVSTHFTMGRVPSARVLHLDTGIGIPATREHVRSACDRFGWPLRVQRTAESYEDMVLGRHDAYPGGFPGRKMHAFMYGRLKERPLRVVVREAKAGHPRSARVLIVSGIRHDESKRRAGYQREVSRVGAQVWVNPLYWMTFQDFRDYMAEHGLPRNPVKDFTGISGECLCGCFADPGELLWIKSACPATHAYLCDLQRRVRAAGFPWGWEDQPPKWWLRARDGQGLLFDMAPGQEDFRPMCNSCEKVRLLDADGPEEGGDRREEGQEEGHEGQVIVPGAGTYPAPVTPEDSMSSVKTDKPQPSKSDQLLSKLSDPKARNLSNRQLAEQLGCDEGTVWRARAAWQNRAIPPEVVQIPLKKLVLDPRLQMRDLSADKGLDDVVKDYARLWKEDPGFPHTALTVVDTGDEFLVADGFLRHQSAKLAGREAVPCKVYPGDFRYALQIALRANEHHGVKRSQADRRKAVLTALQDPEWRGLSFRKLGALCDVSHELVRQVKAELEGRPVPDDEPEPAPAPQPVNPDSPAPVVGDDADPESEGSDAFTMPAPEGVRVPTADEIRAQIVSTPKEPEPSPEELAERARREEEDFLSSLDGVRDKLVGQAQLEFDSDALAYRSATSDPAWEGFRRLIVGLVAAREIGVKGVWIRHLEWVLKLHPRQFQACVACDGTGHRERGTDLVQCDLCRGHGYRLGGRSAS